MHDVWLAVWDLLKTTLIATPLIIVGALVMTAICLWLLDD